MKQARMVCLLVAGAIGLATVQAQPGGACNGVVGSLLDQCDVDNSCFNLESGQMELQPATPLGDWTIGIKQCIKGSTISFITWGPSVDGRCDVDQVVCDSKRENITAGDTFASATVPYGSCTGEPICVYVHDGQLSKGKGGVPESDIPGSCFSSDNQLCAMCGPFLVTPTLPDNSFCDDGFTCTEETCQGGVCMPSNIPDACNDDTTCTDDICVAGGNDPTITDAGSAESGCGYKDNGSCDDGFTCTADLCVALPSVGTPAGNPEPDANGCFFDKDGGIPCTEPRECAVVECVADASMTPGTGCVYTEKDSGNYCKNKYGACAQAVCVDAGAPGYGEETIGDDGCSIDPAADAFCDDAKTCTEDICLAGRTALSLGINDMDVKPNGCGYKTTPDACNDGFSCSDDLCVALPSVAATAPAGAAGGETTGCFINKVDTKCNTPNCATAVCVAAMPFVGDGCEYTEKENFCKANYGGCVNPVCAAADGIMYTDGAVDFDGCNIPTETTANDACVEPLVPDLDCGSYQCDRTPGVTGTGCDVNAGPDFNAGCDDGKACQTPTCSVTGVCSYPPNPDFCPAKYNECANPACDPAGFSPDPDGCTIDPATTANAYCTPADLQCGDAACDISPLAQPGTGTGPLGDGCSLTPDPNDCDDGKACQTPTCSVTGVCSYPPNPDFCPANNPFGACVTSVCAPGTANADDNGCAPGDEVPNACGLANGEDCGSSTCNTATGNCEKSSEVGEQCSGCDLCEENVCTSSCDANACETCDTNVTPPQCTGTCPPDCSSLPVACDAICEECGFDSSGNSACLAKPGAPATCSDPDCSAAPCDATCEVCDFNTAGVAECMAVSPAPPGCGAGPVCNPPCQGCTTCQLDGNGVSMCMDDAPVTYNMVCYKCGTDISCAIAAGNTNKINIAELQQGFKDQCTGNNNLRSCAGQLCEGELAAYVTTSGCFPYSGPAGALQGDCPCNTLGISNFAGYLVTVAGGEQCDATVACNPAVPKCDDTGNCAIGSSSCSVFEDCSLKLPL